MATYSMATGQVAAYRDVCNKIKKCVLEPRRYYEMDTNFDKLVYWNMILFWDSSHTLLEKGSETKMCKLAPGLQMGAERIFYKPLFLQLLLD